MDSTAKQQSVSSGSRIDCRDQARPHLRQGADFRIYDAAMALTAQKQGGKRILSASNETMAKRAGCTARTAGISKRRLVRSGWFRLPGGSSQNLDLALEHARKDQRAGGRQGRFEPVRYEIVEHDEWAVAHPGQCEPVTAPPTTVTPTTVEGTTDDGDATSPTTVTPTTRPVLKQKPAEKKQKKGTASAVPLPLEDGIPKIKTFLLWWRDVAYPGVYGHKPTIVWPRDIKVLKLLFEQYSDDEIRSTALSFLEEKTDFTEGHPLTKFAGSQFDCWRAKSKKTRVRDGSRAKFKDLPIN